MTVNTSNLLHNEPTRTRISICRLCERGLSMYRYCHQQYNDGGCFSHCFSHLVLLKSDASTYRNVLAGNAREAGVRPLVFCREAEHMTVQHDVGSCAKIEAGSFIPLSGGLAFSECEGVLAEISENYSDNAANKKAVIILNKTDLGESKQKRVIGAKVTVQGEGEMEILVKNKLISRPLRNGINDLSYNFSCNDIQIIVTSYDSTFNLKGVKFKYEI